MMMMKNQKKKKKKTRKGRRKGEGGILAVRRMCMALMMAAMLMMIMLAVLRATPWLGGCNKRERGSMPCGWKRAATGRGWACGWQGLNIIVRGGGGSVAAMAGVISVGDLFSRWMATDEGLAPADVARLLAREGMRLTRSQKRSAGSPPRRGRKDKRSAATGGTG